ncbi:hypothetical protein Cch01nite_43640 [Cellulomonas chitinilytica]|uniref:Uncharacterized protein n=1 Tax=Cellulomonas chitinilytica TaxID=398759 RepID=A0A919P7E0_9CELL|nr:hypothetical protein [Cellulomonas chitinilytica]GIG23640.1 hypothetical protein Cch01nite_43640 [Cellulomonas chitinilytica]
MRRLGLLLSTTILGALLVALPAPAMASGSIGSLSIDPDSVRGGESTTGTVDLGFADPTPTVVRLFSSNPSTAQVPASITIPAGQTSGTFTITSNAAAPPEIVQIMGATPDNISRTHNLSVNAATPAGPSLQSVSFVPASVVGGQHATGTVRFTGAMTQGAAVQLSSSLPAVARVPQETVVSANTSTSTFDLTTSTVTAPTNATITARWFGVTRTTTVTVTPGAPPAADVVRITKATWKKGLLTIEATSTNPDAILTVFSSSGGRLFDLTNKGGGRFADQRGFVTNPAQVVVRSNFSGSAAATLKS